jgi:hypothetical protein
MRIHPDPDPVNYREHGQRHALPGRPPPAPTHLSRHHHSFRYYLQAGRIRGSVMGIRIQLFISMPRIQVAKPMRINPDSDPDHGQTSKSQKLEFLHEKFT